MAGKDAIDILSQIEPFDGYGDTNSLQYFLKNCDALMEVVKETEKTKLAKLIFGTKLKGKAQEVTQYKEFDSWDEIREYLLEQFTDKRPPSHFLTQIMNIKQNFRESVKDYGDRFRQLINKYNETCHLNYAQAQAQVLIENLESIVVNNFRKGLNNEKIQIRIIAECTSDITKAINIAVEMELEQTENFSRNVQGAHRNIGYVNQNFQNSRNSNQNSSRNTFCLYCHKNNHVTSQCRQLLRFENNHNNSSFNQNNNRQNFNNTQRNVSHRDNQTYYNNNKFNRNTNNFNPNFNPSQNRSNFNNQRFSNNVRNFHNQQSYSNQSNPINNQQQFAEPSRQIQTFVSQPSTSFQMPNEFPKTIQPIPGNEQEALLANSQLGASQSQ